MARTTPIPARPSAPTTPQKPLIYLICTVYACRAESREMANAWTHLCHLWEQGLIDKKQAFTAIAAGPANWHPSINALPSPYKSKTGDILK